MFDMLELADIDAPRKRGAGVPLYIQLAAKLREILAEPQQVSSGPLPSERLLSEKTGASRVTVRRAIRQLVEEGLLIQRQGSGTYVAPKIEQAAQSLSGFTTEAQRRGVTSDSLWLSRSMSAPTEEESRLLQIASGSVVARLGRVRIQDDEPLAIEHAVVPARFLPDTALVGNSLYEALQRAGASPKTGRQHLTTSAATSIEAGLLSIHEGDPVMRIERLSYLADGTPVELTRSAYRGDRFTFVTNLNGTQE
jgi:GntR family transcriptional regulator